MTRRRLFITGTDTGVGKTALGCGLVRALARRGHRVAPFKPAETGCTPIPQDAHRLRIAAGLLDLPLEAVCPFRFEPPIAPAAAAAERGVLLSADAVVAAADHLCELARPDLMIIEGAGGLLTPYAPGLTAVDLAAVLGASLVLVARNSLGTINHTALALAEIRRRNSPLAGWLLVDTSAEPAPDQPSNAFWIQQFAGMAPLGRLPHVPSDNPDALADAVAAAIDIDRLLRALER